MLAILGDQRRDYLLEKKAMFYGDEKQIRLAEASKKMLD